MRQCMLTTVDNPFDPFTEFDSWYTWDFNHDYHTPGYLARVVVSSEELSEGEQLRAIEEAIDTILEHDEMDLYIKVFSEVRTETVPLQTSSESVTT